MANFIQILAYLNGNPTDEIRGLDELEIKTSFISDSRKSETAQPVITRKNLTFVGGAAISIINYQKGGVTGATVGILEGMRLRLVFFDSLNPSESFDYHLDFRNYFQVSSTEVTCDIIPANGMNSFDIVSRATYFNLLEIKGVYKNSDFISLKYITELENKNGEAGGLALTEFTLVYAGIKQVETLAKDLDNIVAHTAGGVTGPIAGPIYAIAIGIIDLIVFAKIAIEAVKLGIAIAEIYLPPIFRHNTISHFTLLEKAINHLGYEFETNLNIMENIVHFPGRMLKRNIGSFGIPFPITSGIPKSDQPGATLGEYISILLNRHDALIAIIDNTIHLRSVNDPFWIKNSTYILPDVGDDDTTAINLRSENRLFNVRDIDASIAISFTEDATDSYTRTNWKGTSIQVIREPITVTDKKALQFEGLDRVLDPFSLGSRKNSLDEVEQTVGNILTLIDGFVSLFGGNSNLSALVTGRIGALKISDKTFSNSKSIYVQKVNGVYEIPENHRELLSAKSLYINGHARKSPVSTKPVLVQETSDDKAVTYSDSATPDYGNQKALFNEIPISFGYQDFLKVQNNSYFATSKGEPGKIEESVWTPRESKVIQSYWIKEVWDVNIKETFVEPV